MLSVNVLNGPVWTNQSVNTLIETLLTVKYKNTSYVSTFSTLFSIRNFIFGRKFEDFVAKSRQKFSKLHNFQYKFSIKF